MLLKFDENQVYSFKGFFKAIDDIITFITFYVYRTSKILDYSIVTFLNVAKHKACTEMVQPLAMEKLYYHEELLRCNFL